MLIHIKWTRSRKFSLTTHQIWWNKNSLKIPIRISSVCTKTSNSSPNQAERKFANKIENFQANFRVTNSGSSLSEPAPGKLLDFFKFLFTIQKFKRYQ